MVPIHHGGLSAAGLFVHGAPMKLIFAGTPDFAAAALSALAAAGHDIPAGADPARPAGRPRA
ncbi:hypothetical protein LHK_03148 [Laribacter hongkongensis HLHK9]|uniref:Uncharacterized protein n=1 Tax=Laribacter hongkongensis (strain HLHK9) TaxID=557598 RepID=C1D691_LARHH|nr:hypothetical protein LHK_03148 [Laribacter hongkongensis HLHK9]